MKHNWTYKKLGELVNIRTGKLDANAANEGGKYPFFTCSREPLRIDTYSYDCECVLVAGNGELNVKYYKGKFDAYQRTYIIEKKPEVDYISTYYIYLFFQKYIDVLRKGSIGGIIKYIKLGDLTNAIIPIPSLDEQQAIVRELDGINHLIELQEEQLREYDRLAQSLFYTTFGDPATNPKGWEVKKLGDITSKCNTISWSNVAKNDNYYYVDLTSVVCEIKQIVNPQQVNAASAPSRAKQIILEGDILFGTTRPTQRRVCVVPQKYDSQICSTGFCVLRPKKEIKSEWLFFSLCANRFYEYIEPLQTGANYPAVSDSVVRSYKLPLPPLTLQQSFAAQIEAIEQQKALIRRSLVDTRTLLAARMQYYFE